MEEVLDILKAQVAAMTDEHDLMLISDQADLAINEVKDQIENANIRLKGLQKLRNIVMDRIDEL